MSTVTVRLNEEEKKLFTEYSKLYDIPLSTLFKKALENQIEDEMDIHLIREFEESNDYHNDTLYDHEEVKNILGL